jgi:Na+/H+ antiporter NhaC
MNFSIKTFSVILVFLRTLSGQSISSAIAPKIILENIEFAITYSGEFNINDSYKLECNGTSFLPANISSEQIQFKNLSVSQTGEISFNLLNDDLPINQITRYTIKSWISVLPPVIAIFLAFLTRSIVPALFIAIWFGSWAINGFTGSGLFSGLLDSFYIYVLNTILDRDHAIITLFTFMLGGMVGIIYRNGGMHGIIRHLVKWANTPKKGQISIWLFGVVIFFDDYSNTLIVGNTSRMLCDKLGISREKLAYIVDSTSAPVATIAIITTWIGFQVGIISDAIEGLSGLDESAYILFLHSIPYSFYPFLAIFLVGLVVTTGRDIGPMVKAENNARRGLSTLPEIKIKTDDNDGDLKVKDNIPHRAVNAILPILTLVSAMLYFIFSSGEGDSLKEILGSADTFSALMHSTLLSALMAAMLSVGQRILNLNETFEAWYSGLKFMVMGMLVLILAWALADLSRDLHTADFIVSTLGDSIPMNILPAVVFLVAAATAFGSGSSWGVMAILMPLVIPLSWAVMEGQGGLNPENIHILYSTIACVLTGAVWADHCSPISDTTILTSMASGCELMDHVRTQMPYALIAGGISLLLGTIPAGFGMPWWMLLIIGSIVLVILVRTFGTIIDK